MIGIRGAGGDERTDGASLGDSFLEDLPVLGLFVVEQSVHVDRLVELSDVRVNADLTEERLHAEGASFVWDDGHDQFA